VSKTAAVFSVGADPATHAPLYYQKVRELDELVTLKRAIRLDHLRRPSYQLLPKESAIVAEHGYDHAARTRVKAPSRSQWQIWAFHFSWDRPPEWTNGWPMRMHCFMGHVRDEADRENAVRATPPKKPPAREVLAGEELQTGTL
jgi:hypothetical protein